MEKWTTFGKAIEMSEGKWMGFEGSGSGEAALRVLHQGCQVGRK